MKEEDCSYREISERLKINVKKVDNRLRYLKKKLKEKIGE
jgi:DNA-directed RNA polymerase specialized sigma24 family protein